MKVAVLAGVAAVGMAGHAGAAIIRYDFDSGPMAHVYYMEVARDSDVPEVLTDDPLRNPFYGTIQREFLSFVVDTNQLGPGIYDLSSCERGGWGVTRGHPGVSDCINNATVWYEFVVTFDADMQISDWAIGYDVGGSSVFPDAFSSGPGWSSRYLAEFSDGSEQVAPKNWEARWENTSGSWSRTWLTPTAVPLPASATLALGAAGALGALRIRHRGA